VEQRRVDLGARLRLVQHRSVRVVHDPRQTVGLLGQPLDLARLAGGVEMAGEA
jgi:hypothetical protein